MLRNAERACARLAALAKEVETAARLGVAQAAEEAAEEACRRAPVDTGRLKSGIRARSEGLTASVSADCDYAAAVELGTSRRAPQPFMQPAAELSRGTFAEKFRLKT